MNYTFYWINLNRDITRKNYMETIFKEHNIKNIRIPAILGSPTEADKELACTQSHIKAIKTFLETSNDDIGIICEDDLSFDYKPYWRKSIENIIKDAPKDWEIIQLGIIIDNNLDQEFYNNSTDYIKHKPRKYWSMICYAINRKSAEKINNVQVNKENEYLRVADLFLYSHFKTYTYKYPLFTYRDNNDSTIHPNHLSIHVRSKEIIHKFLQETQKNYDLDILVLTKS